MNREAAGPVAGAPVAGAPVAGAPVAGAPVAGAPAQSRGWLRGGEAFLSAQLAVLDGGSISEPSLLPGWTRAHVISHLAGNAHGLLNLLTWARTGVETPMYPSSEARRDAIDQGARRPAAALLGEARASAAALAVGVAQMPEAAWENTVRSALGRTIPASEVPWMRSREVWIHSVDLDTRAWFDAFPAALVDRLLTEVAGMLTARAGCPAVTLAPDDRDRAWSLGPAESFPGPADSSPGPAKSSLGAAESRVTVSGTAADLLGWAIGRSRRGVPAAITSRAPLPPLPRWL